MSARSPPDDSSCVRAVPARPPLKAEAGRGCAQAGRDASEGCGTDGDQQKQTDPESAGGRGSDERADADGRTDLLDG
jgi:hypothetical protein